MSIGEAKNKTKKSLLKGMISILLNGTVELKNGKWVITDKQIAASGWMAKIY